MDWKKILGISVVLLVILKPELKIKQNSTNRHNWALERKSPNLAIRYVFKTVKKVVSIQPYSKLFCVFTLLVINVLPGISIVAIQNLLAQLIQKNKLSEAGW